MNEEHAESSPILASILHPTDFSEGSRNAFHHALKAALLSHSKLTLMHVSPEAEAEWSDFPGVRETLERWGLLPEHSPRSAVPQLGIDVQKLVAHGSDPVRGVLHYLDEHPADLIVLAAHQSEGALRWLRPSAAEPLARSAGQMTLFVPGDNAGFVSAEDGSVSLQSILVPVATSPRAQPAIDAAARLVGRLGCPRGVFTLLHVGAKGAMPSLHCPEVPGWEWRKITEAGDVSQVIAQTAARTEADLVVMATEGRQGFLDALRGSDSEQVLRRVPAPLLTVPVASLAGQRLG